MSEEIDDTTVVEEISLDEINDLIGIEGSIAMLPDEKEKKPNVFSQTAPDMTFLETPIEETEEEALPAAEGEETPPGEEIPSAATEEETDDLLAPPAPDNLLEGDDFKNKGGRPTNMVAATKNLIEKGLLVPFEDDKKIEDYTAADFEELIEANFKDNEAKLQDALPAQFFQNMPTEMQQAYKYIADGGQDLKGLFQAMSSSQEIKELDLESEGGQAYAVRTYLQATNYGTVSEIEEEIQSLQDRGDLEKKANQFKPKLDAMQQNMVNQRIAIQEQANEQRQNQSQQYMDNVYQVLEKGDINGIKLDGKTQNMLYAGLVQPNYPSVSGKQTNLLGHLLEKYQWVEPNHDLIAEALWLLADPDAYRGEIRKVGETAAVEKTVRKLKTEQSNLSSSTSPEENTPSAGATPRKRTIAKPKKNFFAR